MPNDIESAAALLRENGWVALEPGSLDAALDKFIAKCAAENADEVAWLEKMMANIQQKNKP